MGKKAKGKARDKAKGRKKSRRRTSVARIHAPAPTSDDTGLSNGPVDPDPRRDVDATELAARLAGLSTRLQRQLSRGDGEDGLTRARLSALAVLVLGGPRTLGELAAAERVRPPTMTRLVHALEADGLVVRRRNPDDGRSIIISATAAGERLLDRGRAQRIAPLADSIGALPRRERVQLGDASDLLGRVLQEARREASDPD